MKYHTVLTSAKETTRMPWSDLTEVRVTVERVFPTLFMVLALSTVVAFRREAGITQRGLWGFWVLMLFCALTWKMFYFL